MTATIAQSFAKQLPVPNPPVGNNLSPLMFITPKMPEEEPNLKLSEGLDSLASSGQYAQDVESDLSFVSHSPFPQCKTTSEGSTYSLAQRSALANGDLVTLLDTESGGDVGGEVLVALLVTGVLGNVVQVFAADDDGSVHLGGNDGAGQDTATDGNETSEGALLVCTTS